MGAWRTVAHVSAEESERDPPAIEIRVRWGDALLEVRPALLPDAMVSMGDGIVNISRTAPSRARAGEVGTPS